jgi:hypothetical protein
MENARKGTKIKISIGGQALMSIRLKLESIVKNTFRPADTLRPTCRSHLHLQQKLQYCPLSP